MNDNVIRPDRFSAAAAQAGDLQRAEGRQQAEQERDQRSLVRLREIETGVRRPLHPKKRGLVFKRDSDRIAAARAVGELVSQAKSVGVTVESIKKVMPGSTRLDRYSLRPDVDATVAAEQCRKKLQQRVAGYLDAAETIARLMTLDPDALKIRVLSGTSLWSQPSLAESEDDPRADYLAIELDQMSRAVIRRSGLKQLFSRARRIPGVWNVETGCFTPSTTVCLPQQGYLELSDHWTEAPGLPSVPLLRIVHALFLTTVRIESEGRPAPLALERPLVRRGDDPTRDTAFFGTEHQCSFELFREIRLTLGPATAADAVRPMFESRGHVTLRLEDSARESRTLFPSVTLNPFDDVCFWDLRTSVFQVKIDGLWHRVVPTKSLDDTEMMVFRPGDDPIRWLPNPLDSKSPAEEHWYWSWFPVSAETVRYWLDRPLKHEATTTVLPYIATPELKPVFWYGRPSAAHEIEQTLASGDLQRALEEAVTDYREALRLREAEWRNETAAAHQERMSSWQDDAATKD